MPSRKDLRDLANKRRKTVIALIDSKDWSVAAYMMGLTLEYALKAAACRTLKLDVYPPVDKIGNEIAHFKIHDFERLLILSGLRDVFNVAGIYGPIPYKNWSDFTLEYSSDWVSMRYDASGSGKFNATKVRRLYDNLYSDPESILKTISGKKKW